MTNKKSISPKLIRVALYIRVSTEEQAMHGISLDDQISSLNKYAKEHGYVVVGVYADEGISARKKLYKREAFQRLIASVEAEEIDLILFTKLDRWFRNISDYYKTQEILEKHNVDWKAIYENYDTSTSSGRLHINIMLSVAQDEADRTSERIKAVFKNKIANCEPVSGAIPYGYKIENKKMVICNDKAERVRDIFESYKRLRSIYAVLRYYNDKYSEKRSYDFISHMLRNELYIGRYKNNEHFCDPIIEKELFETVNSDKKSSFVRDNQTNRIYLFSGLIRCAECGRVMSGLTTKSKYTTLCGEKRVYKEYASYRCRCGTMSVKTCVNNHSVREDMIENELLNKMESLVTTQAKEIINQKNNSNRTIYENKIKTSKNRLSKLQELFLNDLIDIDEYKKEYTRINDDIAKLESLCKELITEPLKCENLIKNPNFVEIYTMLDRSHKQMFWTDYIAEIKADSNKNISFIFK